MRILRGFIIALAVAFLATSFNNAFAAEKQAQKRNVKTIFDYKTELNLSDDQARRIKDYISSFDQEMKVTNAKLTILEVEIQKLLEKEGDIGQIKSKIKEGFDLRAAMRISGVETTRKINALMSQEQIRKWRDIQAAEKKKKLAAK